MTDVISLANYAVKAAQEQFSILLDFSAKTLSNLEGLLELASNQVKKNQVDGKDIDINIKRTANVWGSYLGEVVRREFGGKWSVSGNETILIVHGVKINPIGYVNARLMNGTTIPVAQFFHSVKQDKPIIAQVNPSKSPKHASMNNYTTLDFTFTPNGARGKVSGYVIAIVVVVILMLISIAYFSNLANSSQAPVQMPTATATLRLAPPFSDIVSHFYQSTDLQWKNYSNNLVGCEAIWSGWIQTVKPERIDYYDSQTTMEITLEMSLNPNKLPMELFMVHLLYPKALADQAHFEADQELHFTGHIVSIDGNKILSPYIDIVLDQVELLPTTLSGVEPAPANYQAIVDYYNSIPKDDPLHDRLWVKYTTGLRGVVVHWTGIVVDVHQSGSTASVDLVDSISAFNDSFYLGGYHLMDVPISIASQLNKGQKIEFTAPITDFFSPVNTYDEKYADSINLFLGPPVSVTPK